MRQERLEAPRLAYVLQVERRLLLVHPLEGGGIRVELARHGTHLVRVRVRVRVRVKGER